MSALYDIVVPSAGRRSLATLLATLAACERPGCGRVVVVDDRRRPAGSLPLGRAAAELGEALCVLPGRAAGPAAARNVGWRGSRTPFVAFLDDDVLVPPSWGALLAEDLAALPSGAAGSQGRIHVPLPGHRRPTDWERNVHGLEGARWATADLAYRRSALLAVGGFDERFPRAYREDADLGLRLLARGLSIERGRRGVVHPVPPAGPLVSVRLQRGNADDVLVRALHGRRWRERAGAPRGRRRRHLAVTASGLGAAAALLFGRRRGAALAAGAWLLGSAELAAARIAPGPRTPAELVRMTVSSVLLPPAATFHTVAGVVRLPRALRAGGPRRSEPPAAVLLDRDGTLVHDVPYNGDPGRVAPLPGAREALERLRAAGVPLALVTNQSGVGRGLLSAAQVDAVNRRVEELLGPLGPVLVCPHAPDDGCGCRKPRAGLVLRAAEALGVEPGRCALIGDTGADVAAARAAGARAVLVPNAVTLPEEVAAAPEVAPDLDAAVDLLIGAPA